MACFHGIWQRAHRQPGRAHDRPGALAAGPRLAGVDLLHRRDLCREGILLQYFRYPAECVSLPRPRRQLAAPPLGRLADPPAPLERPMGGALHRPERHAKPDNARICFHAGRRRSARGRAHAFENRQSRERRFQSRRPSLHGNRKQARARFHISSACCELANLSQQLGRRIVYDPSTRTVPGDAEATRLLARPYRAPWIHPDPANV